ncbi:MAG TPA: hypothetical protein VF721_10930 [Pyrinomonadaceae bacterium]|jgi:hypothetical protein
MKLKDFLFRLAAILTAFMLGVGFFNAAQYVQSFFATETAPVQQQALSVPPRPAPTVIFAAPETVADSKEATETEFYAEGAYYIIGDAPKGFEDFSNIGIITTDFAAEQAPESYDNQIPPKGFIFTDEKFNFTRINIGNRRITFETETKKGVSYKFVGEFIEEKTIEYKTADGSEGIDYAVLKGRLTKWRGGKKIAEAKANFAVGGC